ncbi:MAG: adenine deaminase [Anaerolineae bacterium]
MIELDLLLHNARIADLFRLRTFVGWVGVAAGRFVYVEDGPPPPDLRARRTLDLDGRYLVPGLLDAHMHIESSLVTPRRFAEAVLPFGTTAVLADPHEVANVAGEAGVRWMIAASQGLDLRVFIAIPSCVPATAPELEWTGAVFQADVVERLASEPSVIALGEVMDYQGLLGHNDRLPPMVEAARRAGLRVEGHIPTLRGTSLSRYLAHGITSDHTLTNPQKLLEQLSKGVAVMLQAKSITPQNIAAVNGLPDRSNIILVTDDVEPSLLVDGHLNRIVALAVEAGLPPLEALASASLRPARYLGLHDLGAITPGYRADFLVMDGLAAFPPAEVYVAGRQVAAGGVLTSPQASQMPPPPPFPPVPGPFSPADFRLDSRDHPAAQVRANAVVLDNDRNTLTRLEHVPVSLEGGYALFQEGDGLNLVAVFAREGSSRMVGVLKNASLNHGAFASSLAHDSHNLLVVGREAWSMAVAANAVHEQGGGLAVARGEEVLARLPLPLFGLLSDEPIRQAADGLANIEAALRAAGMTHQRPFLMLSILALSVSPYYKFTDKGVVDTEARRLLPPWENPHAPA